MQVRIIGITHVPEIHPGADLAGLVLSACESGDTPLVEGDVLVVTQKIVSKA
jgi:coenzyme F420-0:L-glutamate ligase/coenzyme F420-1:gamma-L-glutamate ligase